MKNFVLETFHIQSDVLDRDFEITVFSSGKSTSDRPLLIFHDGQNLFEDSNATYGRSWRMLEILSKDDFPDCVFVGVTCGEGYTRFDEYCPFPFVDQAILRTGADREVGGKGDAYLTFLFSQLLPHIRWNYCSQKQIIMGGSSLGGYISVYAALKYPRELQGVIGISNAFWVALDPLINAIDSYQGNLCDLYLDVGDCESDDTDMNQNYLNAEASVVQAFQRKTPGRFRYEIIKNGIHHESSWGQRIEEILRWFLK